MFGQDVRDRALTYEDLRGGVWLGEGHSSRSWVEYARVCEAEAVFLARLGLSALSS
jgi:hypothetical protein